MKRKLISHDVFESIQSASLSAAERELREAEPVLAKALASDGLRLLSYGPASAMYEATDGTYVHASYKVAKNRLAFENIEQLVVDDETEKQKARESLSLMLDALLENNEPKAKSLFDAYMAMPLVRRTIKEGFEPKEDKDSKDCKKGDKKKKLPAFLMMKKKGDKKADKKDGKKKFLPFAKKDKVNEWAGLCRNVAGYVNFRRIGPVLSESSVAQDDRGNVTAVTIPTTHARNEAKLLSFNWKTMKTDVQVLRSGAKKLYEDTKFAKAVADLKRQNAFADAAALEECLENIVGQWPSVLYLTHGELAKTVSEALRTAGVSNYDDQTCAFMAEGILMTAHNAYVDRVAKIMSLAGVKLPEGGDKFQEFVKVADAFYPSLDESVALEMQMFVDLYDALREVYDASKRQSDESAQDETANHLDELLAVIRRQSEPTLEVAEAAANWLNYIVETNLDSKSWDVSNAAHTTETGEHPQMSKLAKWGYAPAADFSGDYGDPAPVSDGKKATKADAEEMRGNCWGNIGGKGVYPDLSNPYVSSPFGDYTMKGEKGVDKDDGMLTSPKGGDTWPSLQNPYCPSSDKPKMKETDLVVDK